MLTFSKLKRILHVYNATLTRCFKHKSGKKTIPKDTKKYTSSVLLPKTNFPLWLNGIKRIERDEKIIKEHGFATLYNWQRKYVKGPEYVLHDGPPYANGMPHMGHAINKILKDITIRHKLLQGHKVHYKPGWDCHGLPIELKAMAGEDPTLMSPITVRCKARKFANEAIRDQKALFRSWGVMADWDQGCYLTFDKSYVKNQLQQFYSLYKQGLVYRGVKPVHWSPSSRSALAEAELEYNPKHVSTAAVIRVRVSPHSYHSEWGPEVWALLWTTTPWTLPANEAIAFSPSLPYSLVSVSGLTGCYIVASQLVPQLATLLRKEVSVVKSVTKEELSSLQYKQPLDGRTLPFVAADHVTAEKGTGLVHTAPSHGRDDFKLAKSYNLPVSCLVDEGGLYSAEAGAELAGLAVLGQGGERVLELCHAQGTLLQSNTFIHSYPCDWRTKKPVIMRASLQWFFDTDAVKERATAALKGVSIIPDRDTAGLVSQVQTRPFWCISRQRVWGVPVPVLYTMEGQPIISKELIDHYCHLLDTQGDDFWWSCALADLAPSKLLAGFNVKPSELERGQDILDIWLDSGMSWSAVLDADNPSADLYLEGVDQFNGWFQSSLITSIALQDSAPYKVVFVHGFAVDENGMKMSKSLGNVVNPQDIMYGGADPKKQPTYGIDTLRWWVAAHGTQQASVPVSAATLEDSRDSVQRLRSIFKHLLGVLHGWPTPSPTPSLGHLDRYMLHCLHALETQVLQHYNSFQYNTACTTLNRFVVNQVSALYCHLTKDRLYCEAEDSERRRAAQLTTLYILSTLTRLVAPVLPLLAEEVYSYQPLKEKEFFFYNIGVSTKPEWNNPELETFMKMLLDIKRQVVKLSPLNCNNWELAADITAPTEHWEQLKRVHGEEEESTESELCELLQVSRVTLRHDSVSSGPVAVTVGLVKLSLCERCRRHTALSPDLPCPRCQQVLHAHY